VGRWKIDQINRAITQMEQVTRKGAANAEECASAAGELNAQSQTVRDVAERLTAIVGGVQIEERGRGAPARSGN
jgi:methyl-accepting chemotaxis protein